MMKQFSRFSVIVVGQTAMALAGFLAFPLIARAVDPEIYGRFSIFLVLLGALTNLEFGRTLFTKSLPLISDENNGVLPRSFLALSYLNTGIISFLAFIIVSVVLDVRIGFGTAAAVCFYCAAAPSFAIQSRKDQIHIALLIRNISQASAFFGVLAGVTWIGPNFPFWLPFVAANLLIFFLYQLREKVFIFSYGVDPKDIHFLQLVKNGSQIVFFNISGLILTAFNRSVLKATIPQFQFGQSSAQADFGLRLNMISNAVSNFVYPIFIRRAATGDQYQAERALRLTLVGLHLLMAPVFLAAIYYSTQIVIFFFGANYAFDFNVMALALASVYTGFASFIIVPWERSKGRFADSAIYYGATAVLVVGLSLWLIPTHGVMGFLITMLVARLGGVLLYLRSLIDCTRPKESSVLVSIIVALYAVVITAGLKISGA